MQVINRLSDASRKAHKKEWQIVMKSMEIALKIMSKNTKLQREYRAVAIDQLAGYYGTKGRRLPKIWQFQDENYANIINLIHTVPIHIVESMPANLPYKEGVCMRFDSLGAYIHTKSNESPHIELFFDKLLENADTTEHLVWLVTMTIFHEMAHAALDIFNNNRYLTGRYTDHEQVSFASKYGKWKEESMATAVTLRLIRDAGKSFRPFYEFAEDYFRRQAPEYVLGLHLIDFEYFDFQSVTDGKRFGIDPEEQSEWLYLMQSKYNLL